MTSGTLTAIHLHPVKACRRVEVHEAVVGAGGLVGDREWQIFSDAGEVLTQRSHPMLAKVEPALVEPWYTRQSYSKLDDPDKSLRIRYWNCGENQNNSVIETQGGATQFRDLTFTAQDDAKGAPK